ncbi:MAG: serpin family protein [Acidobacteriia bacterium]|nr:serpin family protein [Terriglobia bacterium]
MSRILLPFLLAAAMHAGDNPVAHGLNQFGIECYRDLAPGGGNLILSPFSISSALSLAFSGARGHTATEIAAVLHQPYPDAGYPAAFTALARQLALRANGGGNNLLNANALWVQSGFHLEPDFLRTAENVYGAPLKQLDFAENTESARATINSWTDQRTKGKIHQLFGPGSLDRTARVVLTSAVYFYGKWERPFREAETRPAPFKLDGRGTVETQFMHQTASYGYAETPTAQILEMRYAGTGLAWDVVLPKTEDGLSDVEKSLGPDDLAAWLGSLEKRTVEVSFPKFRAESGFSLREMLSRMGMAGAFSGSADFSGMDGRRDLALSDVVHKAFVDVSEEGTEAAAATGATAVLVSAVIAPTRTVFRADHPFLFVIRDPESGLILFAGRLVNPRP